MSSYIFCNFINFIYIKAIIADLGLSLDKFCFEIKDNLENLFLN